MREGSSDTETTKLYSRVLAKASGGGSARGARCGWHDRIDRMRWAGRLVFVPRGSRARERPTPWWRRARTPRGQGRARRVVRRGAYGQSGSLRPSAGVVVGEDKAFSSGPLSAFEEAESLGHGERGGEGGCV